VKQLYAVDTAVGDRTVFFLFGFVCAETMNDRSVLFGNAMKFTFKETGGDAG
jgi:hypothetical protein